MFRVCFLLGFRGLGFFFFFGGGGGLGVSGLFFF